MKVDFNKLSITDRELENLRSALDGSPLQGGGRFLSLCEIRIAQIAKANNVLLTTSATSALDISAYLSDIEDGDEVIVPSYTFVSSINAFVSRGAKPVFCDVCADTLNMDIGMLSTLITERTKVIIPVHYAGVACDMDSVLAIAKKHNIMVVEDAAQGFNSYYKGRHLGTIGDLGTISFHSTKNVIAGEGGALLVNRQDFIRRANYIREKGTNRIDFVNGIVDKYTWVDCGSNYIPSELTAAFLAAQLERVESLTSSRIEAWKRYKQMLSPLEIEGRLNLCKIPSYATSNAHIFFIYLNSVEQTKALQQYLREFGVSVMGHYAPLHKCPMALKLNGGFAPNLPVAEKMASCMLRLPMYADITEQQQQYVCEKIINFFDNL